MESFNIFIIREFSRNFDFSNKNKKNLTGPKKVVVLIIHVLLMNNQQRANKRANKITGI